MKVWVILLAFLFSCSTEKSTNHGDSSNLGNSGVANLTQQSGFNLDGGIPYTALGNDSVARLRTDSAKWRCDDSVGRCYYIGHETSGFAINVDQATCSQIQSCVMSTTYTNQQCLGNLLTPDPTNPACQQASHNTSTTSSNSTHSHPGSPAQESHRTDPRQNLDAGPVTFQITIPAAQFAPNGTVTVTLTPNPTKFGKPAVNPYDSCTIGMCSAMKRMCDTNVPGSCEPADCKTYNCNGQSLTTEEFQKLHDENAGPKETKIFPVMQLSNAITIRSDKFANGDTYSLSISGLSSDQCNTASASVSGTIQDTPAMISNLQFVSTMMACPTLKPIEADIVVNAGITTAVSQSVAYGHMGMGSFPMGVTTRDGNALGFLAPKDDFSSALVAQSAQSFSAEYSSDPNAVNKLQISFSKIDPTRHPTSNTSPMCQLEACRRVDPNAPVYVTYCLGGDEQGGPLKFAEAYCSSSNQGLEFQEQGNSILINAIDFYHGDSRSQLLLKKSADQILLQVEPKYNGDTVFLTIPNFIHPVAIGVVNGGGGSDGTATNTTVVNSAQVAPFGCYSKSNASSAVWQRTDSCANEKCGFTKRDCYLKDSCSGGKGDPQAGCYSWRNGPLDTDLSEKWDSEYTLEDGWQKFASTGVALESKSYASIKFYGEQEFITPVINLDECKNLCASYDCSLFAFGMTGRQRESGKNADCSLMKKFTSQKIQLGTYSYMDIYCKPDQCELGKLRTAPLDAATPDQHDGEWSVFYSTALVSSMNGPNDNAPVFVPNLQSDSTTTLEQCKSLCSVDSGCDFFTYGALNDGKCSLLKRNSSVLQSGVKTKLSPAIDYIVSYCRGDLCTK